MSESQEDLREELRDEEYRYAYAEDFLNTKVATQLKVLRELRAMSQEELGRKIGTQQAGISRLENVNYSAWKTDTLRKLARALGVRLDISFKTFGTLLPEAAAFCRETLETPSFEDDPIFAGARPQPVDASGSAGSNGRDFKLMPGGGADEEQLKLPFDRPVLVFSADRSSGTGADFMMLPRARHA
jgi:transcriptional regulator with XRE-family HTH domain